MSELNFTKQGDRYVAQATVNNRYALHVERVGAGKFSMAQRSTSSGLYMDCTLPDIVKHFGQVLDWEFDHGIYPMHLRIESETEVTSATITEAQ